ncbi:GTPase-associated protein 1-related protein [Streptomyces vinaceus]|uniref:GTPase-associated protein 1-related protein n=1 Tax=Streptomyces vinaceus TaxID=1960 RepID=UPI00367A3156
MNLAQLHYTSAPPGPDGSGFRFTAVTPGVPASLLREAEQLIGYEPPRDAPPRPSAEQLGSFPQALSLNVLSDGSRLLARSVYTGADYSGRWGNFHAHAVHLPEPADAQRPAPGQLPITAWGSPQWAADSPPAGAPVPALASVPAPGPLDLGALSAFVAARGRWLAGFFADVRRLAEDPAAPQLVLVERDSEAVAWWIMLACSVLPHRRGQRLTFTTYTRRPQLARQQIIGVVPEDGFGLTGQEHRYRVYDAAREAAPAAAADPWAQTASRIWQAQRQELFAHVRRLPVPAGGPAGRSGPYEAGPLAALALAAGVGLDSAGRTAAADWAAAHRAALDDAQVRSLTRALARPAADRGPEEEAASGRLLSALAGWAPPEVSEPLVELALAGAVRSGGSAPPAGLLAEPARLRLAAELEPELRAGLADPAREPGDRVALLRVAAELGVDAGDLLPDVARQLAHALITDPGAPYGEAVRGALAELPRLRELVLDRLDALASGDPAAGARLFALTPLSLAGAGALPHLRMCAQAQAWGEATGDRTKALTRLLEHSGTSLEEDPLVLRTAMRLVWGARPPTPGEALLALSPVGERAHQEAGTWELLARAAVSAPAGDRDAEVLAVELLRRSASPFPDPLRASLLLLELARSVRDRESGPGWVRRALGLGAADPAPAAREHAYAAVAGELLAGEPPESEVRALIESNDAELLAAYRRAARLPRTTDRLRLDPGYAAECFATWSSQPQAGPVWQEARTDLLDGVLRPVVRGLPAPQLAAVEEALARRGGRHAEDFRGWQRPGAFGRLRDRFAGSGRRGAKGAPAGPPPRGATGGPIAPGEAGGAVPPDGSGGPVPPGGSDGSDGSGGDGRRP